MMLSSLFEFANSPSALLQAIFLYNEGTATYDEIREKLHIYRVSENKKLFVKHGDVFSLNKKTAENKTTINKNMFITEFDTKTINFIDAMCQINLSVDERLILLSILLCDKTLTYYDLDWLLYSFRETGATQLQQHINRLIRLGFIKQQGVSYYLAVSDPADLVVVDSDAISLPTREKRLTEHNFNAIKNALLNCEECDVGYLVDKTDTNEQFIRRILRALSSMNGVDVKRVRVSNCVNRNYYTKTEYLKNIKFNDIKGQHYK